jgi:hypothetical protein
MSQEALQRSTAPRVGGAPRVEAAHATSTRRGVEVR